MWVCYSFIARSLLRFLIRIIITVELACHLKYEKNVKITSLKVHTFSVYFHQKNSMVERLSVTITPDWISFCVFYWNEKKIAIICLNYHINFIILHEINESIRLKCSTNNFNFDAFIYAICFSIVQLDNFNLI